MADPIRMLIYKVTNQVNGKIYIGITTRTLLLRWNQHLRTAAKGSQYAIHRAIRKYGSNKFTIEQIDSATCLESLIAKESDHICAFDSMNPLKGYNMIRQDNHLKFFSDEVRDKISASIKLKAAQMDPTVKANLYKNRSIKQQGKPRKGHKYAGVHKNPTCQSFEASVSFLGVRYRKVYRTEEEAAKAYDKLSLYLYGDSAKLNFENLRQTYNQEDLEMFVENVLKHNSKRGRPAKSTINPEFLLKNGD